MSIEGSTREPGVRVYLAVWVALLAIVGVETVLVVYGGLAPGTLVLALLALAVLEAGLAVMYFMHLRYERRLLFWSLIPALLFVLLMMNQFWSDAHRIVKLHL